MSYPLTALFSLDMKKKERYFVCKGNVLKIIKGEYIVLLLASSKNRG